MLNDHHEMTPEATDSKGWIDWTTRQQTLASDPTSSAWVSANAGSGKTHVLTQRVIRLLLAGCRPSAILCLTYTKAAASEMSSRVFNRLAEWATISDAELSEKIAIIEGHVPDRIKLQEARRLFAKALETPGGLKIQTIHAFCEALLHQFPLEANVAGHFSVLDDRAAANLLAEARKTLLTAVAMNESVDLEEALTYVLDTADDSGLEALLESIISNRTKLRSFLEKAPQNGGIENYLRQILGLEPSASVEDAIKAFWPIAGLNGSLLERYLTLSDEIGGTRTHEVSYALRLAAKEKDPSLRTEYVIGALFTKTGTPKSDTFVINKAMLQAEPALLEALNLARQHVVDCKDHYGIMGMLEATNSALIIADRLIREFEELKKLRGQLDFDDLIERTAHLLSNESAGAWVHYKLDQGIDHILVDEAQDTSPVQWSIIQSLASDFFNGEAARNTQRTIFAVGDEKQSIYSFQGARPERFSQEREQTKKRVDSVEQTFHPVRLPLSFRSTDDVLAAVDQVFSIPEHASGLSADNEPIEHRSNRIGHPGTVELWEMVAANKVDNEEDWTAPFDALKESSPPAIVAKRIANRISTMIGNEIIVEKDGPRFVEAGDILVLVRKRGAFVNALTRELKQRQDIPVAGADRLRLTDHIAIQDLLALGKFVLLPEDDLSLAAILKSPLFNHTEDDIFELAAKRPEKTGLWVHLEKLAGLENSAFTQSFLKLSTFIQLSRTRTIYDFFSSILIHHKGREQYLGRLGNEVSDVLDEFLAFALDYERSGLPGLQAFISALELDSPEVKREQDKERGEVRIMTVHASKGLEAPIVFLVDGGSKAFVHNHLPKLRLLETQNEALPVWANNKKFTNSLLVADEARIKLATEEEYRRLLYVGMTRSADNLIICGYRGVMDNPDSWHAMITRSLGSDEQRCKTNTFKFNDDEWNGLIWQSTPRKPHADVAHSAEKESIVSFSLPIALSQPPALGPRLPRPLSPSGAGIIIDADDGDNIVRSPLFSGAVKDVNLALEKGRLVHRMLQTLPEFTGTERDAAAKRYVMRSVPEWSEAEQQSLIDKTLTILNSALISDAFSKNSQAEVSVMGNLKLGWKTFAVSGRIDRLAVVQDKLVLVDFKTNRFPPSDIHEIDEAHILQMAIYKEILKPLYPDKEFVCALVYTENASLINLDDLTLNKALYTLKTK